MFFLLLLPGASALNLLPDTVQCASDTVHVATQFGQMLAWAVLLVGALVALAFMAGEAMEKPEVILWSKTEAVALAWSLLLVLTVLGAFAASCSLSKTLLEMSPARPVEIGAFASPADTAGVYLDLMTREYGLPMASELVQKSIEDQMGSMKYAYWSAPPISGGGGLGYTANLRAWAAHKDLLVDLALPLLGSLRAQRLVLQLLQSGVMGGLLPAALLLRMLFVTRDAGNFLIALSFSAYFILPLVYALSFSASDGLAGQLGGTLANPFAGMGLGRDAIVGNAMQRIGFLSFVAIVVPNLALVMLVTATMAINRGLKGFVG